MNAMSDKPARKFKIGDKVIWTDISNGMPRPGVVRAYAEPEGDYDLGAGGPLYDVEFKPGQHWQEIVAEVDLSPSDGTITAPPPRDPFTPYELEQIAWKAGGEIIATLVRASQDRLTIGAYQRPHSRFGKAVTIRMWLDGEQTDAIDLDQGDVVSMYHALRRAADTCWPPEPHHDGQDADEA